MLCRSFSRTFLAPSSLLFSLQKDDSQFLDISCHNSQGNVTLETVKTLIATAIQAVYFQGITRGFDSRMSFAGGRSKSSQLRLAFRKGDNFRFRQDH